jgi:hypothetical protein
MKRLIEFQLADGGSIIIEVDEPETSGNLERLASPSEVIAKATRPFEEAMDKIKPVANAIIAKLRSLSDPPHEMEVEFGLKMSAEAGAIVAATGIEANYKVTLKWKRE